MAWWVSVIPSRTSPSTLPCVSDAVSRCAHHRLCGCHHALILLNCHFTYRAGPTLKKFLLYPISQLRASSRRRSVWRCSSRGFNVDERIAPFIATAAAVRVSFLLTGRILTRRRISERYLSTTTLVGWSAWRSRLGACIGPRGGSWAKAGSDARTTIPAVTEPEVLAHAGHVHKLSVVVPVYQGERTLPALVKEIAGFASVTTTEAGHEFKIGEVIARLRSWAGRLR